MTHADKLKKKARLETELETAMALTRQAWIALSDILKRLDPLTAAALTDLWLQWIQLDAEASEALNRLHRLNDRIAKQEQYPTPTSYPGTIAGPMTSLRTLTFSKTMTGK